ASHAGSGGRKAGVNGLTIPGGEAVGERRYGVRRESPLWFRVLAGPAEGKKPKRRFSPHSIPENIVASATGAGYIVDTFSNDPPVGEWRMRVRRFWLALLIGLFGAASARAQVELPKMKFEEVREIAPGVFFRYSA